MQRFVDTLRALLINSLSYLISKLRRKKYISLSGKKEPKNLRTMAEKVEVILQEFEEKREIYNQALLDLREQLKADIDQLFDDMVRNMSPIIDETDKVIEASLNEFKRLIQRKNDINEIRRKLSPVIAALSNDNRDD